MYEDIGSLSTCVFETRTATGRKHFAAPFKQTIFLIHFLSDTNNFVNKTDCKNFFSSFCLPPLRACWVIAGFWRLTGKNLLALKSCLQGGRVTLVLGLP